MSRLGSGMQQLSYLHDDLRLIVKRRWWRWITCWFGGSAGVIASYRLDRMFYLLLGESWAFIRLFFFPLFLFLRLISANHQIHYRANIGRRLRILHSSLGVVVSAHAEIGHDLILTGGNCIGERRSIQPANLVIGNNVSLGANAVILGPVRIGDNVVIGANAVVIDNCGDRVVLAGVPAKVVRTIDSKGENL